MRKNLNFQVFDFGVLWLLMRLNFLEQPWESSWSSCSLYVSIISRLFFECPLRSDIHLLTICYCNRWLKTNCVRQFFKAGSGILKLNKSRFGSATLLESEFLYVRKKTWTTCTYTRPLVFFIAVAFAPCCRRLPYLASSTTLPVFHSPYRC